MSEPTSSSGPANPTEDFQDQITDTKSSDIELTPVSASGSHESQAIATSSAPANEKVHEAPTPTLASGQEILEEKLNVPQPIMSGHRQRATIHLFTLCWCLFLAGWSDGSLGPLIPRIQQFYNVRPLCDAILLNAEIVVVSGRLCVSLGPFYRHLRGMISGSCHF